MNQQFEAVRSLRLEVSHDFVQNVLSNSAGLSKGKVHHNWTWIMLTIIGSALVILALISARKVPTTSHDVEHQLAAPTVLIDTIGDGNSTSSEVDVQPTKHEFITKPKNNAAAVIYGNKILIDTTKLVSFEKIKKDSVDLRDIHNVSSQQYFDYLNASRQEEITAKPDSAHRQKKYQFTIRRDHTEEEIFNKCRTAYECGLAVLITKYKDKKGMIKHLKLSFAADEKDCDYVYFLTTDLQGFATYTFGWEIDESGKVVNFWDQVNEGEISTIKNVIGHKGQRVFHH